MRKFIVGFFLMLLIIPFERMVAQSARSYLVYSVIGDVYVAKGQQKTRVSPRKQISSSDILIMAKGAALNLLDESSSALCSVTSVGKMMLAEMLKKQKSVPQSLSKQYFSYLMKQLFNKGSQSMSHPNSYMQTTGTSYRSTNTDSVFVTSLLQKIPETSGNFESSIVQKNVFPITDMNVSFSIISCSTGLPIPENVMVDESCYLSVSNATDKPLYVNVLDLGADGSKYLLLPVDSASSCAHLLVPGQSVVDFKSEPFIFGKGSKDETFVLFAVETPIDFSILMNPIAVKEKKTTVMPIGIYKKNIGLK